MAETAELFCPSCGYDLRALADAGRCPECGLAVQREALARSHLPWSHRRDIGRWRAYWRTVVMVLRHPLRVGREVARPVSFADARAFRRRTVLLAFLPVALLVVAVYVGTFARPVGWPALVYVLNNWLGAVGLRGWMIFGRPAARFLTRAYAMEVLILLALIAAIAATLAACSGVASYWFHPKRLTVEQQNRAVAVSFYACAALAATPLIALLTAAALAASVADRYAMTLHPANGRPLGPLPEILVWFAAAAVAAQLAWWWTTTLLVLRAATRCGAARLIALAAALPAAWLFLAALCATAIFGGAVLVALVVMSVW